MDAIELQSYQYPPPPKGRAGGQLEAIIKDGWSANGLPFMLVRLISHDIAGVWGGGQHDLTIDLEASNFSVISGRAQVLAALIRRLEELGGPKIQEESMKLFWGGSLEKSSV